jgi:hypothetical protein
VIAILDYALGVIEALLGRLGDRCVRPLLGRLGGLLVGLPDGELVGLLSSLFVAKLSGQPVGLISGLLTMISTESGMLVDVVDDVPTLDLDSNAHALDVDATGASGGQAGATLRLVRALGAEPGVDAAAVALDLLAGVLARLVVDLRGGLLCYPLVDIVALLVGPVLGTVPGAAVVFVDDVAARDAERSRFATVMDYM